MVIAAVFVMPYLHCFCDDETTSHCANLPILCLSNLACLIGTVCIEHEFVSCLPRLHLGWKEYSPFSLPWFSDQPRQIPIWSYCYPAHCITTQGRVPLAANVDAILQLSMNFRRNLNILSPFHPEYGPLHVSYCIGI